MYRIRYELIDDITYAMAWKQAHVRLGLTLQLKTGPGDIGSYK